MEKVAELIKKYISADEKLAVGVSGGKDSMCLLHFLMTSGTVNRRNLIVANVEHGIRGGQSKSDTEFVEKFCLEHDLKFISQTLDIPTDAKKSGRSIETEARLQRMRFFDSLFERGVADKIALAHHADDQCETVLMHIFRGSGLKGLKGMTVLSGHYFRPFLCLEREEIDDYAKRNAVPYVEDVTNFDDRYNRNFIRHSVLPLIRTRWPGIDKALLRLSAAAVAEDELISSLICSEWIKVIDGVAFLALEALENRAMAALYIVEAFKKAGLEYDFETTHIDSVMGLKDANNGSMICLPHNIRAIREYENIAFYNDAPRREITIPFGCGVFVLPFGKLVICECPCEPKKGELRLDYDKIAAGAVVRLRQEGDIFKPYGGGTKKLKQYLIDKKIPYRIRDRLPVIASDGKVYAVCGLEISDEVKLTPSTLRAVKIEFTYFSGEENNAEDESFI